MAESEGANSLLYEKKPTVCVLEIKGLLMNIQATVFAIFQENQSLKKKRVGRTERHYMSLNQNEQVKEIKDLKILRKMV